LTRSKNSKYIALLVGFQIGIRWGARSI
jgi:hypothetical protein